MSSARARAEEQFARLTRPRKENAQEQDQAGPAVDEKTARLRALRLAKEAAEREAATAAKPARKKTPA